MRSIPRPVCGSCAVEPNQPLRQCGSSICWRTINRLYRANLRASSRPKPLPASNENLVGSKVRLGFPMRFSAPLRSFRGPESRAVRRRVIDQRLGPAAGARLQRPRQHGRARRQVLGAVGIGISTGERCRYFESLASACSKRHHLGWTSANGSSCGTSSLQYAYLAARSRSIAGMSGIDECT